MALKSYSVRIDSELLDKFHVVAAYEGRSANAQLLFLIRRCVERYESKHEVIQIGSKKTTDT